MDGSDSGRAKEARMPRRAVDTGNTHPVLVDLALQGGGSHGAFTWGVLDRLLEEPWLRRQLLAAGDGLLDEARHLWGDLVGSARPTFGRQ
jgi:hypothetical protein